MAEFIIAHEPQIRLAGFAGIFALIALWETLAPQRTRQLPRARRWPGNLGIVVLNTLLLRLLFPVAAVGIAVIAGEHGWGLFNITPWPLAIEIGLAVLLLDLLVYGQHRAFHALPWLWRLHRMHHADTEFDVTTGARFHPLEILLSMLIKMVAVALLGASALAVIVFEVLLNATAMFNHGNIRLPAALDGSLRLILVTPDMHRVHHSWEPEETDSNFGFNLPWWDRLFGSYRAQPRAGQQGMTVGLHGFRDPGEARLDRLLTLPFRGA